MNHLQKDVNLYVSRKQIGYISQDDLIMMESIIVF